MTTTVRLCRRILRELKEADSKVRHVLLDVYITIVETAFASRKMVERHGSISALA